MQLLLFLRKGVIPGFVSNEVLFMLSLGPEIATPTSNDEEHVDAQVCEDTEHKCKAQEVIGKLELAICH
jgi:hypothetical protein